MLFGVAWLISSFASSPSIAACTSIGLFMAAALLYNLICHAYAGPPPYADVDKYFASLRWANGFDPPIRGQLSAAGLWASPKIMLTFVSPGPMLSQRRLLPEMLADDLTIAKLAVPVVIIEGDKDLVTPRSRTFFDAITPPSKRYVTLAGDGHLAIFADRSRFLETLLTQVRPLAD